MPKSSPRAETAYQALRQAIIEQALLPGAKLPEDQIGGHFGVSRTLVRATLARLTAEGLVEAKPRRTATVARPTLEEAGDVFELRRVLEREAVALAIKRWRPEFGAILEGHVREEDAAKARRDERVSIRLAGEFHAKLAAMSGNAVLERMLSELVSRCSLILALYARPHSSECAVAEHSAIVAALRERNVGKAVQLSDEHIGSVQRRALLAEDQRTASGLLAVLARYGKAIEAKTAATPLIRRKRSS